VIHVSSALSKMEVETLLCIREIMEPTPACRSARLTQLFFVFLIPSCQMELQVRTSSLPSLCLHIFIIQ